MSTKLEVTPRERIIETALNLFYKQGYLATGINQIIAESKVAKATFYTHFPSKAVLCVAYLQARHDIWMGWLDSSVAQNKSPKDRLFGIFYFLKAWMTECEFRGCAFLNIASEIPVINSEIRNEVIIHKKSLQNYIQNIIEDMVTQDPSPSHIEPRQMANIVYVLVEGAIASSQNFHEIWPITSACEALEQLLLSSKINI